MLEALLLSEIKFYDLMFPILLGLMAIYFLTIGLRAVLTKRPFLISNRWWLSIMFVVFHSNNPIEHSRCQSPEVSML